MRPSPQGPTRAPGSRLRARRAPDSETAVGDAGQAEPPTHSCAEAPRRAGLARPTRRQARARLAVCARGRGRPLTGLRGVAIGRVRLNVDVLHARDAAAQDGAHGARRAGVGRGRRQRRPHADMARTRPHGRLSTVSEALASKPPPLVRPGARRHGGPPPHESEACRETKSPRRRGRRLRRWKPA